MPFPVEDVITAEILQTAEDGGRVVIYEVEISPGIFAGRIEFFSGAPDEIQASRVQAFVVGGEGILQILSPVVDPDTIPANLVMTGGDNFPGPFPQFDFNAGEIVGVRNLFVDSNIDAGTWNGVAIGDTTPLLNAPYTELAGREVKIHRDLANNIHITGVVNRNGAANGLRVFTLPSGFRPYRTQQFLVDTTPAGALGAIVIDGPGATHGQVSLSLKIGAPTVYTVDCTFPGGT